MERNRRKQNRACSKKTMNLKNSLQKVPICSVAIPTAMLKYISNKCTLSFLHNYCLLSTDWEVVGEETADKQLWEDNWDDDNVEDDFSRQLRYNTCHMAVISQNTLTTTLRGNLFFVS